ncbi:MAG TPA: PAS domain S-box protein, partial [Gammaproteobacteria bacterium]|nr:PAS domain S-box protein [Gammaproteobacteria bacterium]
MQQGVAQSPNLIETLQRYADLFTFAPVGYVVMSADGTVQDINRAAAAILGCPRSWVVGQPFVRWIIKKDGERFKQYFGDVYSADETVVCEFRIRDRRGRLRDIRLDSVAMVRRGGGERLCQASILDVTAQRSANRETQALHEELAHVARLNSCGEMVAALAHELNQPLGAIMLYCKAALISLESELAPPAQLKAALEKIGAAASHATGTIRSLRSFLAKTEPVMEDVDLNGVLVDGARMAGAYAKERRGRIELRLAEGLPIWHGNRVHLQQVLLNLLQNSLDAMHAAECEDASVIVASRLAEPRTLRVSVEDSGPGMTPKQRRKALEPFFT